MSGNVRSTILVARTLIDEYARVAQRMMTAFQNHDHDERDSSRAELERVYGAIWEQLDSAAAMTRAAERGTAEYAALRSLPGTVVGAAVLGQQESTAHVGTSYEGGKRVDTYQTTLEVHHNGVGLRRAREAAELLQRAWPEVDWHDASADEPVPDLTPDGLGAKLARFVGRLFKKD